MVGLVELEFKGSSRARHFDPVTRLGTPLHQTPVAQGVEVGWQHIQQPGADEIQAIASHDLGRNLVSQRGGRPDKQMALVTALVETHASQRRGKPKFFHDIGAVDQVRRTQVRLPLQRRHGLEKTIHFVAVRRIAERSGQKPKSVRANQDAFRLAAQTEAETLNRGGFEFGEDQRLPHFPGGFAHRPFDEQDQRQQNQRGEK